MIVVLKAKLPMSYCEQDTTGVELARAYRTHFNKEYEALKSDMSVLERGVLAPTSDAVVDKLGLGIHCCSSFALLLGNQV